MPAGDPCAFPPSFPSHAAPLILASSSPSSLRSLRLSSTFLALQAFRPHTNSSLPTRARARQARHRARRHLRAPRLPTNHLRRARHHHHRASLPIVLYYTTTTLSGTSPSINLGVTLTRSRQHNSYLLRRLPHQLFLPYLCSLRRMHLLSQPGFLFLRQHPMRHEPVPHRWI